MIKYADNLNNIQAENLKDFFVDWPNPPSTEKHLEILENSDYIWLAIDEETNNVVGFITAVSDKVISSYIPLLEVLPEYKNRGIGSELVKRILDSLKDLYMVDLICNEDLVPFYNRFDMFDCKGMILRNYENQNCEAAIDRKD